MLCIDTVLAFEHWTRDLVDARDYKTTVSLEADGTWLETKLQNGAKAPNANWILYNLWIDETWATLRDTVPLCTTFILTKVPDLGQVKDDPCLTATEAGLVPYWQTLGVATVLLITKPDVKAAANLSLSQLMEDILTNLPKLAPASGQDHNIAQGCPPHALNIQKAYLLFDYFRALYIFLGRAISTHSKTPSLSSIPKKRLEEGKKKCADLFTQFQTHARQQKSRVSAQAIFDLVETALPPVESSPNSHSNSSTTNGVEDGKAAQAQKLHLRQFADGVARSAEEAWEGLVRVKLPSK